MLILSRHVNESIVIDGGITITVVEIRGSNVRLGIDAPDDTTILRSEIDDLRDNRDRMGQDDDA